MGTKELQGVLEELLGTSQEQIQRYLEGLQKEATDWARFTAPTNQGINSRGYKIPIQWEPMKQWKCPHCDWTYPHRCLRYKQ